MTTTDEPSGGPSTVWSEMRSDIEAIERRSDLYEETHFAARVEATEHIEFNIIDRIVGLLQGNRAGELIELRLYAERVKTRLEDVDDRLFQRLRAGIRGGDWRGRGLEVLIEEYAGDDAGTRRGQGEIGYDNLDAFVNGLLLTGPAPLETKTREPEMVFYQPTPARIILELVEKADFTGDDVFYDLGSGLGQVPILVNLLCGVEAKGLEFEPAFCDYARSCAAGLDLSGVEFINADARTADLGDGSVFFMYTPFQGRMLRVVLERLHEESRMRSIRLFTYGPCTPQVSRQDWLERADRNVGDPYRLGEFRSLQ